MTIKNKIAEIRNLKPDARAASIAKDLGVSRELVRQYLKQLGLPTKFDPVPNFCPWCGEQISLRAESCRPCRSRSCRVEVKCSTCD